MNTAEAEVGLKSDRCSHACRDYDGLVQGELAVAKSCAV